MDNWICIIRLLIVFAGCIIAGKIALDFLFKCLELRRSGKKGDNVNPHLLADKPVTPEGLLAQFIRLRNETLCGQGKVGGDALRKTYDDEFESILKEVKELKSLMGPKKGE